MTKLMKSNPWKEFVSIRDEFDRMLDIFRPCMLSEEGCAKKPMIDVSEDEKNVFVKAELPGIKKEDISLTLEEDILTLSGKSNQTQEEKKANYYRKEIREGAFSRSIKIPSPVEKEKVSATYKDGLLEITLPKTPEEERKTVRIAVE
ncbi:MAG: Hsp20/alpha crystallin family protein [Elusimicrobia bacterium]|nr:Hsp20/alpha crystallin family protein [Elusimicrobiota bacterium]